MKLEMSNNWFWVIMWCIIVGGCVADKAVTNHYNLEQQKLELQRIEQSAKIAENNMKQMVDTLKQ